MKKMFKIFSIVASFLLVTHSVTACSIENSEVILETKLSMNIPAKVQALVNKGYVETAAKGLVGEMVAIKYIKKQSKKLFKRQYVNIKYVLKTMGCDLVSKYLRSASDTGIDDIFVVTKSDGTPNYNYLPIFHESKYSSSCNLVLSNTETKCQQMSIKWLKANMQDISNRVTGRANVSLANNGMKIRSCSKCFDDFKRIVRWLKSCISKKKCHRTASVLCPDGKFKLFLVQ